MNRRQKLAAQVAGVILIIAFAFPPWRTVYYGETAPDGRPGPVMWAPIWNPIRMGGYAGAFHGDNGGGIAWDRLALELAIIAVLAGVIFVSVKDKE